jgi:tripartite-type tricarboxylate transporter receptor subunit TctC
MRARLLAAALLATLASLGVAAPAGAESGPITLYIGYGPGGGYDVYCRLFAAHLGRHLPGNPAVVPRNEPGAGSYKLANELYNIFPKDGTALGMIGESLVIQQALGDPAAKFDAGKFAWIGRFADSDPVMVTRPDSGIVTIEDARNKETIVGVPGAGSATALIATVVNSVLGTRFKLISGYDGSAQIKLAVERGEVQGTSSTLWPFDEAWVRANKMNIVYQTTLEPVAGLENTPTVVSLGRSEEERALLRFFAAYTTIGRSILAPPGLSPERVAALRAAFDATVADPAFIADAAKQNLYISVMPGTKLQALVEQTVNLKGPLLEKAKILAGTPEGAK